MVIMFYFHSTRPHPPQDPFRIPRSIYFLGTLETFEIETEPMLVCVRILGTYYLKLSYPFLSTVRVVL